MNAFAHPAGRRGRGGDSGLPAPGRTRTSGQPFVLASATSDVTLDHWRSARVACAGLVKATFPLSRYCRSASLIAAAASAV